MGGGVSGGGRCRGRRERPPCCGPDGSTQQQRRHPSCDSPEHDVVVHLGDYGRSGVRGEVTQRAQRVQLVRPCRVCPVVAAAAVAGPSVAAARCQAHHSGPGQQHGGVGGCGGGPPRGQLSVHSVAHRGGCKGVGIRGDGVPPRQRRQSLIHVQHLQQQQGALCVGVGVRDGVGGGRK